MISVIFKIYIINFCFFFFNHLYANVCVEPSVLSSCCSYQIQDQYAGKNPWYKGTSAYFSTENLARNFISTQKLLLPLLEPFKADVTLSQAWLYNDGKEHAAMDWQLKNITNNQDVSFKVFAAASGRVITKTWDDWLGNLIIIEHLSSNGQKFRSLYMHLRDGFSHDLNLARSIKPKDPNSNDNWAKYKRFSMKTNANPLYWGQEEQKIAVKVGDMVSAGDFLAWSGNTGAGGAGNGLQEDGTPKDLIRANNHLHFMLAAQASPPSNELWVYLDPYGVYEKEQTTCYDILSETKFARTFAPFPTNFYNLDEKIFHKYFNYWPNLGYGLQTLSTHYLANTLRVSGSFQSQLDPNWVARYYFPTDQLPTWLSTYEQQGYRPRELSMTLAPNGRPFLNVIWKKIHKEKYFTFINMSEKSFQEKYEDLVNKQGFRIEDFVSYQTHGTKYYGAIFIQDNDHSFHFFKDLNKTEFQNKLKELNQRGFKLTSLNVSNASDEKKYAGIWRNIPGNFSPIFDLTSNQFLTNQSDNINKGLRLQKIEAYENSTLFAAIWTQ